MVDDTILYTYGQINVCFLLHTQELIYFGLAMGVLG